MERSCGRHDDGLGGRLEPFAQARMLAVSVVVAPVTAHVAATRHCAWVLKNLLACAVGIVTRVRITCPYPVPVAGRIVPPGDRSLLPRDALLAGG